MPSDQITFRTDPRIKARIEEVVRQGGYRNVTDFVNRALLLMLEMERARLEHGPATRALLEVFFDSPPGRRILQEVIRGERER